MIPLSYTLRNVLRRPLQALQLISGIACVVLLIMLAVAMNNSMKETLGNSSSPRNVILLGAGSEESMERSEVSPVVAETAASLGGILEIMKQPAISPEIHFNGMIGIKDNNEKQGLIRGVLPQSLWVHENIRLIEGRFPNSGEIMIGHLSHRKLGVSKDLLQIGNEVSFQDQRFKIVGVFDAKGTVMEAEIWMPLTDLMTLTQRDTLSCVVLKIKNEESFSEVEVFSQTRLDLELVALRESEYYEKLSYFYAPVRWMAWISAVLISIGAFMSGLNTLFAAFSSRIKEFGVLQTMGFSRFSIFLSLLQEALITGFLASLAAASIGIVFLDEISFPFAIGVFVMSFDNAVISIGILTGLTIGLLGVIPPSWNCLSPSLPKTLRST